MAWTPVHGIDYQPHHVRPLDAPGTPGLDLEGRQSLMQLVDLALQVNPETRSAWESARASAASYGSTRAAWYPVFGLTAALDYNRLIFPAGNNEILDMKQLTLDPGAQLSYILLDFGRRSSQDAEARHALWAANLEFNRAIQTTIYEVQRTYFQLDAAMGLYEASLQELDLAITVVDAVEDSLAVGLATAPELLFARQELAQAEFDVQARIAEIDDAKSALLVAIGLPATIPIEIESLTELPLPGDLEFKVDEAISTALQGRPDLAGAVAKLRSAEAAVQYAQADFYPTIQFDGSVAWSQLVANARVNRGPFDSTDYGGPVWNVGITGTWILFEGYELRNNLREARALRRKAQADLETLRIQAIGEVWDSYNDYRAAQRQYDFGVALVESSRESYDAMIAAYEVGLATITELVAAEKDLAAALATLVETRSSLLTSMARVSYSIGSGIGRAPKGQSTNGGNSVQAFMR